MALWRVDVAEVSHRYVEAPTAEEAQEIVAASILAELSITASPASRELATRYEAAGPIARKRLLASMDGLISPSSRRTLRSERRRLERVMRWEEQVQDWLKNNEHPEIPMPDPLMLERLTRINEVAHIETNMRRLQSWDRQSPMHDGPA